MPYADIQGNEVTIHNIRNSEYHSETGFDMRHDDTSFDLDTLRMLDLFLKHWCSPFDWRMLINGKLDELLSQRGAVATQVPLAQLKRRALANSLARAADQDPAFAVKIREGMPEL